MLKAMRLLRLLNPPAQRVSCTRAVSLQDYWDSSARLLVPVNPADRDRRGTVTRTRCMPPAAAAARPGAARARASESKVNWSHSLVSGDTRLRNPFV